MYDPVADRVDGLACQLLKGPLHGLVSPFLRNTNQSKLEGRTATVERQDLHQFSRQHSGWKKGDSPRSGLNLW